MIEQKDLFSSRLLLRRVVVKDLRFIAELRNHPLVRKFVRRQSMSDADILKKIRSWIDGFTSFEFYFWVICKIESQQPIGTICLWNIAKDRKSAELGYELYPDFWGQGYMSESLTLVLRFAKDTLLLDEVNAHTEDQNLASRKMLERHDFVWNRHLRDDDVPQNVIYILQL